MNTQRKTISDVFKDLKIDSEISEALRNAAVASVKLFSHEKRLEVRISPKSFVDAVSIASLEQGILLSLPLGTVEEINIIDIYAPKDPQGFLAGFWANMLYRLRKTNVFAGEMIVQAPWKLESENDSNILCIDTASDVSAIFRKMGIANIVESILLESIGLTVKVKFGCVENKNKAKNTPVKIAAIPAPMPVRAASSAIPKKSTPRNQGKLQKISGETRPLDANFFEEESVVVAGRIFRIESRETKSKKLLYSFDISDGNSSISIKFFLTKEKLPDFADLLKVGAGVKISGNVQFDQYSKEINIMANRIGPAEIAAEQRIDNAKEKRVELHLHTNMSQLDGITPAGDFIARAAAWGHDAVAITDHGVLQAFPDAMAAAKKHGIKVIYGVEAYLVDDLAISIVTRAGETKLADDFVVFDIETTGFNRESCAIIEIGAVKVQGGKITEVFNHFIDPKEKLPAKIIELTHITDDMLTGQPTIDVILPKFLEFIGDATLVAHNADFDMGFLEHNGSVLGYEVKNPYLCTLQLSRALYPDLSRHGLAAMVKHHGIVLENHHRASDDASALAQIFLQQMEILHSQKIVTLNHINLRYSKKIDIKRLRPHHTVILVKNSVGLRNLYELVSKSHIDYFFKQPRIPKSELLKHREGLIVGTACEAGEFYTAVRESKAAEHIEALAEFYDYFEIHPMTNNMHLVRKGDVGGVEALQEINRKIVELGERFGKPVVAAGDAHYIDPGQEIYRSIIMAGNGFKDVDNQPALHFMTTDEMLEEFAYLGEAKAREVVVTNSRAIADMVENILPIPQGSFPPVVEGSEEQLKELVTTRAMERYGNPLPEIVEKRMKRELSAIIGNGFATFYIIARQLVVNSMENGYLVGSRGSIGSSFVATMAEITEVNPLSPHYYCPTCQFTDFDSEIVQSFAGASGCDMPDRKCPKCATALKKDGHSIPFETFLGFNGDKEPDIDLNFSGEYQGEAHKYAEELFGEGYIFKAGTIGTIAERTAFGYVKKYLEERGIVERGAEVNRLVSGCTGIKRTTGQHPGGLVVVPKGKSIYEFTPVQHPANDTSSGVITTHFDYHSIEGRLFKLDILGHDVPTIIRMLHDLTGLDPREVDIADEGTVSLFSSPTRLGVTDKEIGCKTGSLGLPEFGTHFVRQMLMETRPASFAELVRISGLSHGTDVWAGNALDLVRQKIATLSEIIPSRDDIMVYLILKGVAESDAFKIMENVRKGKGITDEEERIMLAARVPKWYIESCRKIKYLFPKGHAVAYVMMTMRIGYYKIHYPEAFYAATFSVKSDDFDYVRMCLGSDVAKQEMRRINSLGNEASQKDDKSMVLLELVTEMYARGLKFAKLDIYKAHATKFLLTDDGLMPPLCAVAGLGETVADTIVAARQDGEFFSVDDLKNRTRVNKNVVQLLKDNGILEGMPETEQLTLF
ncbi:MAG: PolC-type DNA polymerase III [Defluviitaleaceae bacterium]|nr:PolC-type DNA polymerase III [Defluviitaleaceae bacterium]